MCCCSPNICAWDRRGALLAYWHRTQLACPEVLAVNLCPPLTGRLKSMAMVISPSHTRSYMCMFAAHLKTMAMVISPSHTRSYMCMFAAHLSAQGTKGHTLENSYMHRIQDMRHIMQPLKASCVCFAISKSIPIAILDSVQCGLVSPWSVLVAGQF